MAKALIGKISEFDVSVESFENYTERLEHFFSINSINDEGKKVSYFISIMGPALYTTMKDLLHPKLVKDVSFGEIITLLSNHFKPKCNITYERFIFNRRNQKEGESISEYSMQIKKLASTCDFGTFLDEALRDKFLCGLRNHHIQSKLLAEGDKSLSFSKALELALVLENAEKNVKSLHGPDKHVGLGYDTINFVKGRANSSYRPNPKGTVQNNNRPKSGGFQSKNNGELKCFRCGKSHNARACPYIGYACNVCKKKGHLANMCRLSKNKSTGRVNLCDNDSEDDESQSYYEQAEGFDLNTIAYANRPSSKPNSFLVKLNLNSVPVEMVLDTGACITVMPDHMYYGKFHEGVKLKCSNIKLKTYTNENIKILGEFDVSVDTGRDKQILPVVVIKGSGVGQPMLLGRNWMERLRLDWNQVKPSSGGDCLGLMMRQNEGTNVPTSEIISSLKEKYSTVFDKEMGEIKNVSVELNLKENAKPVFCKARVVPFALREKVDKELTDLQNKGVIYPVTESEWAAPIVVVPKPNNDVRICCDFKKSLNPCLTTAHYPLPNPDEIFSQIAGAELFTKLDLSAAYNQLKVSQTSQELLTVNTSKGLFRYARLPFGVTSASSIFQQVMDKILLGLDKTFCYIDDILIVSRSHEEMMQRVEAVLSRLAEYNVKVNTEKSQFFVPSLTFLGHRLDKDGIHQSEEITRAISNAPRPENVTQLRSFLGLVNYYGKFLSNLSTLLHPLHNLLNKNVKWVWCDNCENAFQECKSMLVKDNVLMPFDPRLEIVVTSDSSHYGVGAVLAHILPDGTERPVAFASRTLSKCEVKYGQIEKEALSLIFAVKKFHQFLYGRKFTLISDHKPLIFLLGPTKGIPTLSAARIQRWALTLAAYQYDIKYKKGEDIPHADGLSRLPCKGSEDEGEISFFSQTYQLPITHKEISIATKYDPILSKVLDFVNNGWPNHIQDAELKPFSDKTLQLSVDRGCLLWGNRVVIPATHREEILLLLHSEHPGESKMKSLARSYTWWPNMDRDIEEKVKTCMICQKTRKSIPLSPLQPWAWSNHCWQRVHLDFAHQNDKDFLILVDSYSKWIEIFPMSSTTSDKTIEKLRHCFAAYGLPTTIVTDGGPQFKSQEFGNFLKSNGIHHVFTPPYHPASNGLAERAVQTVKAAFLKQLLEENKIGPKRSLQHKVDAFLFVYRNTPHSVTGQTPSELLFKVKPKTHLTLLKPHLIDEMKVKQEKSVDSANQRRGKSRMFRENDKVFVKTVRGEKISWEPGRIIKIVSPVTYIVSVSGRKRFTHCDHLRASKCDESEEDDINIQFPRELFMPTDDQQISPHKMVTKSPIKSTPTKTNTQGHQDEAAKPNTPVRPSLNAAQETTLENTTTNVRRSQRVRRGVERLNL